jgi:hypothetical protein
MTVVVALGSPEDPSRNEALLCDIGVSEDVLMTALRVGDAAADGCTSNHPPMARGFYRFSETVASLAVQLTPLGWTRKDYKNFSTVLRPDGRIAIAVASADDGTGDLSASVTTRSSKGVATVEAVAQNYSLPLDERYVADNAKIVGQAPTVTWFLLHNRKGGQLFAELSRPMFINDEGFVEKWEPRIPLRALSLDQATIDISGGEPPINPIVDVKKR